MNNNELSFEAALKALDDVLLSLSNGDIPLEEALNQYKIGIDMAMVCQKKLQAVEGELKVLQDGMEQAFALKEEVAHE